MKSDTDVAELETGSGHAATEIIVFQVVESIASEFSVKYDR